MALAEIVEHSLALDLARRHGCRVFKQVVGVWAEPELVTNVTDSDYTFTGLPSGKTLKVQINAANEAGQAAPSVTAEIMVP